MNNPLYNANKLGLGLVSRMAKVANTSNVAAEALRQLGPKANMKKLNDEVKRLNQGLGALPIVAIGAAIGAFFFYGAMHKAAKENKKYADSWTEMKKSVREAIQPMIDVFIAIMVPIYDFIKGVADLIVKFNEAHPILAKMIQGVLLLIPALTLILLPLGLGIGYVAGLSLAFGYLFRMIAPIITFLATMSATVWIVAAAIIGIGFALIWAWNNVAWFRDGVTAAWEWIKTKSTEMKDAIALAWDWLKTKSGELKDKFVELKDKGIQIIADAFDDLKTGIEENETALKNTAITLGVIFGPALIVAGTQAVIAGAKIAFGFTMSIITAGIQAAITAAVLTGQFIISMVKMAAQAVITGITMIVSLVGSMIRVAVQGWITVASITAQTIAWIAQRTVMIAGAVVTGVMTAAQWLLNAAIWANPITWLVLLIVGLIAIGILLYKNWDTVVEKAGELWSWLKDKFAGIKEAIMGALEPVIDLFDRLLGKWDDFKSAIDNFKMPSFKLPSFGGGGPADGSHKTGLDKVPFDGYKAVLHKNEAVLTAEQANTLRSTGSLDNGSQSASFAAPTYTPESGSTTSNTNNNSSRSVVFSPTIQVSSGDGESASVRQQIQDAMAESFGLLTTIYSVDGEY
jgi:hypothetical protein